jgi:hypothetical protein
VFVFYRVTRAELGTVGGWRGAVKSGRGSREAWLRRLIGSKVVRLVGSKVVWLVGSKLDRFGGQTIDGLSLKLALASCKAKRGKDRRREGRIG